MAEDSPPHPPDADGAPIAAPADPRAGLYDIVLEFVGEWSEPLKAALVSAAERIEGFVLGDLPDVALPSAEPLVAVDDILIRVELPTVDGVGGAFGAAGPTLLRAGSLLPFVAHMRFDADDAAALDARGTWDEVALHEMLHCLGFGTLWAAKGLTVPGSGAYTGAAGMAEYAALGNAGPVPVELTGGLGTAGLHWSEAVFQDELMTGWMSDAGHLSKLTVGSLSDLGYVLAPRAGWVVDAAYA